MAKGGVARPQLLLCLDVTEESDQLADVREGLRVKGGDKRMRAPAGGSGRPSEGKARQAGQGW